MFSKKPIIFSTHVHHTQKLNDSQSLLLEHLRFTLKKNNKDDKYTKLWKKFRKNIMSV